MKFIKRFLNVADANAQVGGGLDSPHVDVVADKAKTNFIKVNASKFTCTFNNSGIAENVTPVSTGHALGDIAYWDGSKVAFTPYTQWQSSLGTALGVCFIPTSHAAAWGDGKARFLSVKGVTSAGTAADSDQYIPWDSQCRDAGLTKRNKVPTWDNTIGGSVGSNGCGYISSDKLTGVTNAVDALSKYERVSGNTNMIPSPYATDGGFYADYMREILSGETNVNALADFNGKANTAAIVTALGADGGEAAKACSLYSTNGIAAGEWYLPACGELAYIMPRFNVINSALTACNGVLLVSGGNYWSSSECNANDAYYVRTGNGRVDNLDKYGNRYVRPAVLLS